MCLRTASEPDSSVTGKGKWPGRAGPGGPDDYFNRKKKKKQETVAIQGRAYQDGSLSDGDIRPALAQVS